MKPFSLIAKFTLPALCFLFILAGKVHAAPVLLKEVGLSSGLYAGSLTLPVSSSPLNYFAGIQNIQIDNDAILQAFCIDPFQWSPKANISYQVGNDFSGYFGADTADVAKLYSLFYASTLGNNLNAAGFQLALWELVADSSKNLTAGLVRTNGNTNANIVTKAQSMLDALAGNSGTDSFTYTLYTSSSHQDYLVVTPSDNQIPAPQSIVLLALALGLMARALRHRT